MTKYNYKIIFLFFSFLFLGLHAQSQNNEFQKKEKAIYDSLTFHYYEAGIWDSVIDIGKEALYKGYDFYYLRMRIGLAYDYQGNFRLAEKQYKQALKLVPPDVSAAYYKYYAAINGGRENVAYADFKKYNLKQAKAINQDYSKNTNYLFEDQQNVKVQELKIKTFDHLYFAYGYSLTGNNNELANIYPNNTGILYSQGNIRLNQSYLNFNIGGNISSNAKWNLTYNNSRINGVKLIQAKEADYISAPTSVIQNELYTSLSLFSGDGWNIKATAQLIHYNSNFIFVEDSIKYKIPENTEDTLLIDSVQFGYIEEQVKGNDYVFGLSLNRKVGLFDFSIFGTYANILDENPFQIGGEITILPKGNYTLYLTNRLFYYHDNNSDRYIYKVSAGTSISKKMNLDASATFGNLQFTNEPGLAVVYNWAEKTTFKGDIVLSYQIIPKLYLSLRYQITQKQSLYNYYQLDEILPSTELDGYYYATYKEESSFYKFNQHFVILGLSWIL